MRAHNGHIEDYIFIHFRAPAAEVWVFFFFLNTIAENDALELRRGEGESALERKREGKRAKKEEKEKKGEEEK